MSSRGYLVLLLLAGACAGDDPNASRTYEFGPFHVEPSQEISDQCVQITLHNDAPIYVNQVELTTGPGFHHSNWFYVPEHVFAGDDGQYTCLDRNFNEPVAAIYGGVLFAQSTQSPHEIQSFPAGVSIEIPAHAKIVGQLHLLNPSDAPLDIHPTIALTSIPQAEVTTTLAGLSFENHALGLPPNKQSRFTLDCDLAPQTQILHDQGQVDSPTPDFKLYYALAHYHALGTGMSIEAVKPDGSSALIYSTTDRIGDTLGGTLDPAFDMTGYTRIRFSCDYYNPRASTVGWGIGDQEMCVFLAFTDSKYVWGGGEVSDNNPGDGTDSDGVMSFTHPCQVFATELQH